MKTDPKKRIQGPLYRKAFRFFDKLVFSAICAAALWIPFRQNDSWMLICSAVLMSVLLLLILFDRKKAREEEMFRLETIKKTIRLEKLLLADDEKICAALHEPDLYFIRKTDAGESDLLAAVRNGNRCILFIGEADRFQPLIKLHAPDTRLIDARACMDSIGIECSDAEAIERLAALQKPRRKRIRFQDLPYNGRLRFILLGTLLFVLSYVWKYKIYYRLLAMACFVIPVISGTFGRLSKRANLGNFLDNAGK